MKHRHLEGNIGIMRKGEECNVGEICSRSCGSDGLRLMRFWTKASRWKRLTPQSALSYATQLDDKTYYSTPEDTHAERREEKKDSRQRRGRSLVAMNDSITLSFRDMQVAIAARLDVGRKSSDISALDSSEQRARTGSRLRS